MSRYIFVYGGIVGALIIITMIFGIAMGGAESSFASQAFGYTIMLVALSMIFVATKRYRDRDLGGVIRFGQAMALGLGIAAVSGVAYVVIWEAYLAATDYAFIDEYAARTLETLRAEGASADAIASAERMNANYAKLWFRLPVTFSEIFPVGALVSLVSSLVLRKSQVLSAT